MMSCKRMGACTRPFGVRFCTEWRVVIYQDAVHGQAYGARAGTCSSPPGACAIICHVSPGVGALNELVSLLSPSVGRRLLAPCLFSSPFDQRAPRFVR